MVNGKTPYTKDKELKLLVINCIVTHKSNTDSLKYLHEHDYPLSRAQFERIKSDIKQSRHKRTSEIANTGFIDAHLEAIDTFTEIKKEMWLNYYAEQNPYKKVEILTQIANLQPYINEYYSTTREIIEDKDTQAYKDSIAEDKTRDKE